MFSGISDIMTFEIAEVVDFKTPISDLFKKSRKR